MDTNELIQVITEVEYCPPSELVKMNLNIDEAQKFPIDKAVALGTAFKPLAQLSNFAADGAGGSGLYYVNTAGKKMFESGGQYIGTLKAADGGVGGGVARLTQLRFDPTTLCVAATIMTIEKSLGTIYEAQKEMLAFLEMKEEAKLKGNLNALADVLNNYKFNWDNEKYKNNKHILVQDIKRDAEQSLIFYRERLEKAFKKDEPLRSNSGMKSALNKLVSSLKDLQLALYIFSFSSFLEVMLLENFASDYLNSVAGKIEEYLSCFNELYKKCTEKLESVANSSIAGIAIKGLSKISGGAGRIVEKIPGISKSRLDENLIKASSNLIEVNESRVNNIIQLLADCRIDYVSTFAENVKLIDKIFNHAKHLLFDNKNIYICG